AAAFSSGDVAAVIVEPVAGNMGVVPPDDGFLQGLRSLCDDNGALLIFDEVMTGFRVARGGAQERYGVTPDLTCLGKVVAGGTPAAAYGGRTDLMRTVAPDGPVYQAGTLAGNPLATAAGIACLRRLIERPEIYDILESVGERMESALSAALVTHGVDGCVQRVGAMMTVFFGPSQVRSWDDAATVDRDRFARFFQAAYAGGVLLPPSQFEALFLMESHVGVVDEAIDVLVSAVGAAR
ncbi:MAG: aminotransferase class III-fold pyridoxal phosphate-dependent enzyme, partial [Acidimicrobiia bacterium]